MFTLHKICISCDAVEKSAVYGRFFFPETWRKAESNMNFLKCQLTRDYRREAKIHLHWLSGKMHHFLTETTNFIIWQLPELYCFYVTLAAICLEVSSLYIIFELFHQDSENLQYVSFQWWDDCNYLAVWHKGWILLKTLILAAWSYS